MWVSRLKYYGCCWKPDPYEELELPRVITPIMPGVKLPLSDEDPCIGELKDKVIDEYYKILDSLECGVLPDLDFILDEISFLEVYDKLDKRDFILQYFLNTKPND